MATRAAAPPQAAGEIPVENPATGETIATVPALGAEEVRELVAAARAGQPAWEQAGFEGRAEVLLAARRWMAANGERVVQTIVAETGRPPDETHFAELAYGLSALEFWAKQAPAYLADEEIETASPFLRGRDLRVRYAPVGTVGVIGPWNYPLNNSFGDCIPALAAGNAVVLKPSEVTPLTSLLLAQMLAECGLPEGVFGVASGPGETGAALVDEVDFVMFTGSVETGKKVMARAARTLTPVSLELGGKDPMIVLADADLERAANAAVSYGMNNSGQVCISVERIYVEEPVHDEFLERLTEKVRALRQGPPGPPGAVDVGAIIFPPQLDLIEAHVRDAVERGARVLTGGRRADGPGRFFEPTVLADVDHSMRCMTEETFGPTLPVMRVSDVEEAIALANDGPYGLQASVWTRDVERGESVARRIESGVACVNDAQVNYAALELPMGGWKASGLGSRHGPDGIRKYTKRQSLLITPGTAAPREAHMFPYSAQVTETLAGGMALLAGSDLFSDEQRVALRTLCDTLVPSLDPPSGEEDPHGFWGRSASDFGVPEAIEAALLQAAIPDEQRDGLRGLLDALTTDGLVPGAPLAAREAVVHAFSDSGPEALAGITALRGLTMTLFYAMPDLGTGINPSWPAIGYQGPRSLPPAEVEETLRIHRPAGAQEVIEADVCVVGSGAGGAVIAAELAGAGKHVCVLDAGSYSDERHFDQLELTSYRRLLLNEGPFPTFDGQVSIQAGSAVGGGTVVNWTNCLRTHEWVRAEWAAEHGLEGLDGAAYDAHLDAVLGRLQANQECSDLNGPHERLREACEKLGYDFRLTVRNADRARYDPESAGFMGFGDQSGAKLSTAKTFLRDAQEGGAQIVADCRAERIVIENGRAAGVEATFTDPATAPTDGAGVRVLVRAPVVVVACGSIESPALLLRSGIGGPAVGRYLRLHPTSAVTGIYPEPQSWWWGPPQAALSHQFANVQDGYGFLVESAQHTTGLFSAATAWESGREHKRRMSAWSRYAPFINLTRDRGHGRVSVDAAGNAVIEYLLTDELDVRNFRLGLAALARLHEAAGAEEILALGRKLDPWRRGEDLDAWIERLTSHSLAPREFGVFSAHQMGSCRMGHDPEASVANPDGELHDVSRVWVGDASAFPTASGTNPMITIMALARRTAGAIAAS